MPIFDYRCQMHGTRELFVKTEDRDSQNCPVCKEQMERLVSAPLFKLDGTDPAYPTAYANWAKRKTNP
jgi:putative FmdB family regulatory protein